MSESLHIVEASLPWLQLLVTSSLLFLAGLASCLSLWVIPLILTPPTPSRSMIAQFEELFRRGLRWLQPGSRLLCGLLVLLALLTSQHPNPTIASRWKYHAAAGVVLVQTAWYEAVFIFPINDRIKAMKGKFTKGGDGDSQQLMATDHEKLVGMLRKWQALQWGRVILPLSAGVLSLLPQVK